MKESDVEDIIRLELNQLKDSGKVSGGGDPAPAPGPGDKEGKED